MTTARGDDASVRASRDVATLDVAIPVYNEETDLDRSVRRLRDYLDRHVPFPTLITIVDSDSVDGTLEVAQRLAADIPQVRVIHLDQTGKGRAVRTAWSQSESPVVAYMDVDLSTDLTALLPLVAPLLSGHSDVAVATRLTPSARVARGARRELISRCYNLLLRLALRVGFTDAQCGFKAMRTDKARVLLPLVRDEAWFFDSELLVLAERAGMRVHEVPVDWVDDPDSRVNVRHAVLVDLMGVLRLRWGFTFGRIPLPAAEAGTGGTPVDDGMFRGGEAVRFGLSRLAAAVFHVILYLAVRSFAGPQWSNLFSFVTAAVLRTPAGRWSGSPWWGLRHPPRRMSLVSFGLGLATTAAALAALHVLAPGPSRAAELAVLTGAHGLVTLLDYGLSRTAARTV
jgi:glycosyltransferase involved in cell wall biosynthesis